MEPRIGTAFGPAIIASKIPSTINLEESKSTGPVSMLMAMNDKDIKKGLGVLMELTKGLATLKSDNN